MKTYYDVLQLLKEFGTYIHVGKRLWDIELAAVEVDRLHHLQLIDDKTYASAKIVLRHEHEQEEKTPLVPPMAPHEEEKHHE
ncbi:YqgQ family protein [Lacticaseibacillus nasuensis]|uniref:YqgQ family protein n=1 Tax=Lacticaseibacillus nasuensis TaxID=944671 RepID=UPI0022455177|nr:YqgQ family protein [Lacticaseibacillus nasuensis]MCX2454770.1 YqgQ family protein [Lacticaseibacillus nasuensis]